MKMTIIQMTLLVASIKLADILAHHATLIKITKKEPYT